ncbi:MAG TPA: SDR family oxidoreductase [Rhizorhapis sp.]
MLNPVLDGRVALITGSGSGIGFAIAQRLAAHGAKVVLSGRSRTHGEAAEKMLRDMGAQAKYVPVDIAQEDDVRKLVDMAIAEFGSLSMLVNNAGPSGETFGYGALHELPGAIFEQTMRVGAFGAFWACKYALPHMIAGGGGSVVNISAIPATRALPHMGAYAMAKAGLEALGRQVANDYAVNGIRCNNLVVGTVRPESGDVSTLPADFDHEPLDRAIAPTTMLGTVGRYADVAAAALFLVSDQSRYITGANIPVEGGALGRVQYPDYTEIMTEAAK